MLALAFGCFVVMTVLDVAGIVASLEDSLKLIAETLILAGLITAYRETLEGGLDGPPSRLPPGLGCAGKAGARTEANHRGTQATSPLGITTQNNNFVSASGSLSIG